ncbi:MAG: glucuronate isomerase [Terriglobales bacterium]
MTFINEDFLLQSKTARRLYHDHAVRQPILDYHCHLSARDIAENRQFRNLHEIWLEGDHYKWRAMRANGVPERYCTGDADPYDKYFAWAETVPHTLRNPLYHWTHLELQRYFGIDSLLNEKTARKTWDLANERLAHRDLSAQGILGNFHVTVLCTTDDPVDSLANHERIASQCPHIRVLPGFRPDNALRTEDPNAFNAWVEKLAALCNLDVTRFDHLLQALRKRHDDFHQRGCRLSDHGLDFCYAEPCTDREAEQIFDKVRGGSQPTSAESAKFASFLMLFFGRLDAEKGWTKQLHLGACRNTNTRMVRTLGPDTGFDSIGDWQQAGPLLKYLDRLHQDNCLPKVIVYNLNPADDYVFASMIGDFQDGSMAGKIQFGSAWWFLDQKEGIEWQLNALSTCGLLSRFVGMTTDSRSFMSFPRHEYFRRVLCNLLGNEVEAGLLPNDEAMIGAMVGNVCYNNAVNYFAFPPVPVDAGAPAQVAAS